VVVTAAPGSLAASKRPVQGAVDPDFWRDRRVLLTGHTGFKGAWLTLWLQLLGAHITGFSLRDPPTEPSLYELARVEEGMEGSIGGDVRDFAMLARALDRAQPEVVVHMAAQSLVRRSYANPRETYEVNVMGTVNLLDAVRQAGGDVRAVVIVTSDKCYENREWEWSYREHEPMGGHDPYSNSKGCAELVTDAYRRSFFSSIEGPSVASARAGNVIGGGDWSEDRLVADLMRGAIAGEPVHVRNPCAVRPWQHVLNPLSGYLALAQVLCSSPEHARGWNFGPVEEDSQPVGLLVERLSALWPGELECLIDDATRSGEPAAHEAHHLKLDSSLARARLGWRPRWDLGEGLRETVRWYRGLVTGEDMRVLTLRQIEAFQHAVVPV
jgi:CDP-glucose 4,6-dehydratase